MTINPHDAALEQALAYDAAFVPRFAQRFGERLLLALDLPPRANVLDLACRTGYPAVQVLDRVRGQVEGVWVTRGGSLTGDDPILHDVEDDVVIEVTDGGASVAIVAGGDRTPL